VDGGGRDMTVGAWGVSVFVSLSYSGGDDDGAC